jgi:phosphoglycolate phosphatase
MIGDRSFDVLGAKEQGIASAGVLWGYGSLEELKGSGADFIFERVEDIEKTLL